MKSVRKLAMLLKNIERKLLLAIYTQLRGKKKLKLSLTTLKALENTEK